MSLFWGGLNTAVLIGSSLTMAMAVRSAQTNNRKATVNWLILTMILGCVFLGVKVIEYAGQVRESPRARRQLRLGVPRAAPAAEGGEHAAAGGSAERIGS